MVGKNCSRVPTGVSENSCGTEAEHLMRWIQTLQCSLRIGKGWVAILLALTGGCVNQNAGPIKKITQPERPAAPEPTEPHRLEAARLEKLHKLEALGLDDDELARAAHDLGLGARAGVEVHYHVNPGAALVFGADLGYHRLLASIDAAPVVRDIMTFGATADIRL